MAEEHSSPRVPATQAPAHHLPQENVLEIDDADCAYAESLNSDTTSLPSAIAKGYVQHGQRYQATKEDTIGIPSDDIQFESMSASHLVFLIMESQQKNSLFRSPIGEKAQHVLDLGTGNEDWATDVADRFPSCEFIGCCGKAEANSYSDCTRRRPLSATGNLGASELYPMTSPSHGHSSMRSISCTLGTSLAQCPSSVRESCMKRFTGKLNALHHLHESGTGTKDSNLAPGAWFEHVEQEVEIR